VWRSFINKLRDPDEGFVLHLSMLASTVPLSFGIFFLIVGLVVMFVGKRAETGSELVHYLDISSRLLLYLAVILVLGSSIVLHLLKIYMRSKFRKNKGV
jgi:hypothetical protein